jgi:hypothetical protein
MNIHEKNNWLISHNSSPNFVLLRFVMKKLYDGKKVGRSFIVLLSHPEIRDRIINKKNQSPHSKKGKEYSKIAATF